MTSPLISARLNRWDVNLGVPHSDDHGGSAAASAGQKTTAVIAPTRFMRLTVALVCVSASESHRRGL